MFAAFLLVFLISRFESATPQATYKAAVVEYAPMFHEDPQEKIVEENVRQFVSKIEEAAQQHAQIIVFPEAALSGWNLTTADEILHSSTSVPEPSEQVSICTNSKNTYAKFLVELSCAAQTHKIYTVVNVNEVVNDTKEKPIFYNTDVVFDKNGVVIAKHRKVNLFKEPQFTPGNNVTTFKTDFGVTFGVFTCFDILFKHPAITVLENDEVTDIVFPTAWFSETPFLVALSAHSGYATENGVNLLAAGYNDPQSGNGGSGIYLANGKVGQSYISGMRSTKMLMYDVPINHRRLKKDVCLESFESHATTTSTSSIGQLGGRQPDISSFKLMVENMNNYTFKPLNLTNTNISEQICLNKGEFCCYLSATLPYSTTSAIHYKLAAFYGVTMYADRSAGVGICGVVACTGEDSKTCGVRPEIQPAVVFNDMVVKVVSRNASTRPVSVLHNLNIVENYHFCSRDVKEDKVETVMRLTQAQDGIVGFGIYQRIFDKDGQNPGSSDGASFTTSCLYTMLLTVVLITLR